MAIPSILDTTKKTLLLSYCQHFINSDIPPGIGQKKDSLRMKQVDDSLEQGNDLIILIDDVGSDENIKKVGEFRFETSMLTPVKFPNYDFTLYSCNVRFEQFDRIIVSIRGDHHRSEVQFVDEYGDIANSSSEL